jgi:hypothetical protein
MRFGPLVPLLLSAGLAIGAVGAVAACAEDPFPAGRVVVLGMDGLEYQALHRYADRLPTFSRFFAEGAHAEMEVTSPIMSPIVWTTMASGYPAEVHGVGGWTNGRGRSFTGADVRVERVWDVVSASGGEALVAGWLMTWPAPILRGQVLTDRFVWSQPMSRDNSVEDHETDRDATTYPDRLASLAATLVPDAAWLAASPLAYQVEAYGAPSHPLRRDETHVRVFETLWPTSDAALGVVYVNGADQVSHLYWPFQDPEVQRTIRSDPTAHKQQVDELLRRHPRQAKPPYWEKGVTGAELAEASRWVPDYYVYLDGVLDRVWRLVGPDTTLVLLSDHGFQCSSSKPLVVGGHRGGAVFAAVGPRVKARSAGKAHVLDVAPTLYALLGLPAAADMPGRVLDELFDVAPLAPLDTRTLERGVVEVGDGESAGDDALRSQLEALGYLDAEGRPNAAIGESRRSTNVVVDDKAQPR